MNEPDFEKLVEDHCNLYTDEAVFQDRAVIYYNVFLALTSNGNPYDRKIHDSTGFQEYVAAVAENLLQGRYKFASKGVEKK